MPEIKVNGNVIQAPPGKKLLDVLEANGTHVPHYCWHPGLPPHGNCRMCLVKVSNSRKLEVACMYPCTDKLEVTTESPEIDTARKAVMEYLLINHPLDCPICDKAGECRLQDYTYEYRKGVSRFDEDKVIKDTKDLGPNIRIWGNRCISCTRCVRFTEEISGDGELSIVNRGDHSQADVHPDVPLDNPMSLNVVDICPVGALIDKNFLFQARVWFAERIDTTCTLCSRGCSTTATVHKGEIKRIQPRHNPDVNGYWMCDAGRLDLKWVRSEKRLSQANAKGTVADLAAALKNAGPGKVGILVSSNNTLEELYLVRLLGKALYAKIGVLTHDQGTRWVSKSGFAIETDKTGNRAGAAHELKPMHDDGPVVQDILAGEITHLVVINNVPNLAWPDEVVSAAKKAPFVAVADILDGPLVAGAQIVIPSSSAVEKDGTMMNRDGRIQRIRKLVDAPAGAKHDVAWLQEVLVLLGARKAAISAEGVFREAFPGLDYKKVGALGTPLPAESGDGRGPRPDGHVGTGQPAQLVSK